MPHCARIQSCRCRGIGMARPELNSMRILLLTQWFDPEPTFKGLLFAREFAARGHDVEVLTGFPNYPGGDVYPGYRIRPWVREQIDGVSILRVALYPSHDKSAFGRVLNYTSFAISAALIGTALIRKPDVVYVYNPRGPSPCSANGATLSSAAPGTLLWFPRGSNSSWFAGQFRRTRSTLSITGAMTLRSNRAEPTLSLHRGSDSPATSTICSPEPWGRAKPTTR